MHAERRVGRIIKLLAMLEWITPATIWARHIAVIDFAGYERRRIGHLRVQQNRIVLRACSQRDRQIAILSDPRLPVPMHFRISILKISTVLHTWTGSYFMTRSYFMSHMFDYLRLRRQGYHVRVRYRYCSPSLSVRSWSRTLIKVIN